MFKNILYSTLWNKCPKCHKSKVFVFSLYNLKHFDKMNKSCNYCAEVFEKEPGYFYGAMYVSYALMVGWFVITWATDQFFVHAETWKYFVFVASTITLFMPLTFRISRLIWLNFFIKYDKKAEAKQKV